MKQTHEWRTLVLTFICYGLWLLVTANAAAIPVWLSISTTALLITLHGSLQHEFLHGHPFKNDKWNELLGFPALGFLIPYRRFKTLHIQHHTPELLTDPLKDPESNFVFVSDWNKFPFILKQVLHFNNCLAGRILIGPVISNFLFLRSELKLILAGSKTVLNDWLMHIAGCLLVIIWLVSYGETGLAGYFASAYIASSLLLVRTFLEHQSHEDPMARSVIIDDRGLFGFLYLNNNLHSVHHNNPDLAWYLLPSEFINNRKAYLAKNSHYYYNSYLSVFMRYLFKAKDPVAHPLLEKPAT